LSIFLFPEKRVFLLKNNEFFYFSWTTAMWTFSWLFWLKHFTQFGHWKGLNLSWTTAMWYLRERLIAKYFSHFWHLNVFCLSCKVAMWVFRFTLCPKHLLQLWHWNGLNLSWTAEIGSRCYIRLDFLRQFKSDWLRRLEGLVFEKKISFYWTKHLT